MFICANGNHKKWSEAELRAFVGEEIFFSVIDVPQADVLVIGLCECFAYGSADNPLIAAIGVGYPPRVWLGDTRMARQPHRQAKTYHQARKK